MEDQADNIARQTGYDAHRSLQILSTIPAPEGDTGWRGRTAQAIIALCTDRSQRRSPFLAAKAVHLNGRLVAVPFMKGGLHYTDTALEAWANGGSDA